MVKTCRTCKIEQPLSEFYQNKIFTKDGFCPQCKTCYKASKKRYTERLKARVAFPAITNKTCTQCKRFLVITEFSVQRSKKSGFSSICKPCRRKAGRGYVRPNRPSREEVRRYRLQSKYNLTMEDYNQMSTNQNGLCALCCNGDRKGLVVDHCHKTGRIRGLLCTGCNTALGRLGDTTEAIKKVLRYLSHPKSLSTNGNGLQSNPKIRSQAAMLMVQGERPS